MIMMLMHVVYSYKVCSCPMPLEGYSAMQSRSDFLPSVKICRSLGELVLKKIVLSDQNHNNLCGDGLRACRLLLYGGRSHLFG